MNESDTPQKKVRSEDRIPRPVLAIVLVGLLLSVAALALSRSDGRATGLKWGAVEQIDSPEPVKLGSEGSLGITSATLSATAPNLDGGLIFQVAAAVSVDSGGTVPTTVRCDVSSSNGGETMIARTTKLRAAWPRPSEELKEQEVPDLAVAKFKTRKFDQVGMPIRDYFRRYTDSGVPTSVEWSSYHERSQNWVWSLPKGTGVGTATLHYAVIFKTYERPAGEIACRARTEPKSGPGDRARVRVPVKLVGWPIPDSLATGPEPTDVE
ncbi:MAG: hypothetical protein M9938_05135 [Solirubrobacterales bacterium]|nr:hypothetical protein [Solirubrobacterales bacterium]